MLPSGDHDGVSLPSAAEPPAAAPLATMSMPTTPSEGVTIPANRMNVGITPASSRASLGLGVDRVPT